MRRRARVDANHGAIVDALRRVGWIVVDTSRLGRGFPDLLAARRGVIKLVEVKDGAKPKSRQALTEDERALHGVLALAGVPVSIVTSVEDAVRL